MSSQSRYLIALISKALNASDPKTFKALEQQLQQLLGLLTAAELDKLLKLDTNPRQNTYLWRLLSAAHLVPLAFGESEEQSINADLLTKCSTQQIKELLELLSPKQKTMIESA